MNKEIKKKRYAGISNLKVNGHKFKCSNPLFETPKETKNIKNKSKKILFRKRKIITYLCTHIIFLTS